MSPTFRVPTSQSQAFRCYSLKEHVAKSPPLCELLKDMRGASCARIEIPVSVGAEAEYSSGIRLLPPDRAGSRLVQQPTTLRFLFDSGADHMMIPIHIAERASIPFSNNHPGGIRGIEGKRKKEDDDEDQSVKCYFDFVTVHSSLLDRQVEWICAFAETDLDTPILGRAGFLDYFNLCLIRNKVIVTLREPPNTEQTWRQRIVTRLQMAFGPIPVAFQDMDSDSYLRDWEPI
jgi:hypothetical protein